VTYPDFVYPAIPAALRQAPGADQVDPGWRFLQNDDRRSAARAFAAALRRNPGLYPAQTGQAYVALADGDHDAALQAFDAALRSAADYVPALVGRGQTLLALDRGPDALAAFEAALARDPSLADVQRRVQVLRFRNVQQLIERARTAAAGGRLDEARAAYEGALATSPDSAFLHRELAVVERRQGNSEAALSHFRRASELDPADAASLGEIGDLLAARQDLEGAQEAYRRAAALDPSPELSARIAALAERLREARLPAEFRAIPSSSPITRGELAALIGVHFEALLARAPVRQVVITDTAGHWAADWITRVARAGIIDPFENHTFQPRTPVRRGDLALAVSRIVSVLAAGDPELRARIAARPSISDMSTGHLSYPAASIAVASGVMRLDDGRFQVNRAVSGAEAIEIVNRLRDLARGARGAAA
jgi:tetratricopeptide (TPR) repeat protein